MKLPFLKESKWPVIREDREMVVNPSHDVQLSDHLLDQILMCTEKHDSQGLLDAVKSLIQLILSEDQDEV